MSVEAEAPPLTESFNPAMPLADISPWDEQPRPRSGRNDQRDKDLCESIGHHGVLQPIVVRPKRGGGFLIVVGERRFRAARTVGLQTIPASVRHLSDAEALTIGLIENLQRQDMHALEEAQAIHRLQGMDRALQAPGAIAAQLGLTEGHVRRRLKLLRLCPEACAAFLADAITAQHAEQLVKVSDHAKQLEGLKECFIWGSPFSKAVQSGDWVPMLDELAPVAEVRNWARRSVVVDVRDVQDEIPELKGVLEAADTAGVAIVQLSRQRHDVPAGILSASAWKEVRGKKCAASARGVVVHGGDTQVTDYCANLQCFKHWPENKPVQSAGKSASTSRGDDESPVESPAMRKYRDDQAKQRAAEAAWGRLRTAAWPSAAAAIKKHAKLTSAVVLDVLGNMSVKEVHERTGTKLTNETALTVLILHGLLRGAFTRRDFAAALKPYHFDLNAFERQRKAAEKANNKAAKKAAPRKSAVKSKAKGSKKRSK